MASRPRPWKHLSSIRLAIEVMLLIIVTAPASQAVLKNSPKALVDQAWQIVQHNYVDRSFNKQDWTAVRSRFLQPTYTSTAAAYSAI